MTVEEKAFAYQRELGMNDSVSDEHIVARRMGFLDGYKQAEKDLTNVAVLSSGPDGFYYGKGYQQGMKDAEKKFGWHSVEESLPPIDEEVNVLTDAPGTAPIYKIGFGHIVDRRYAVDYDGWNTPRVKYWMPCPTIPGSSDM